MTSVRFVTDGRVYDPPPGKGAGEFVVFFGSLLVGPAAPPRGALVVPFSPEVVRPDGTSLVVESGHLDYPIHDESPGEGPFVLLRGVRASDVPAGSVVVSRHPAA